MSIVSLMKNSIIPDFEIHYMAIHVLQCNRPSNLDLSALYCSHSSPKLWL